MEVALYGNNMGTRYVPKLIVSTMCVCVCVEDKGLNRAPVSMALVYF